VLTLVPFETIIVSVSGKTQGFDGPRNFLTCLSLSLLDMRTLARHKLRIIFLAVYIPLSISVGMLHSDDLCGGGSGRLIVETQSAQILARSPDNGFCFACLFTAGHIVNHEPFVPVLSPTRAEGFAGILITTESSPQPHPARAPPVFPLL
jgi:hypothetical protein